MAPLMVENENEPEPAIPYYSSVINSTESSRLDKFF